MFHDFKRYYCQKEIRKSLIDMNCIVQKPKQMYRMIFSFVIGNTVYGKFAFLKHVILRPIFIKKYVGRFIHLSIQNDASKMLKN